MRKYILLAVLFGVVMGAVGVHITYSQPPQSRWLPEEWFEPAQITGIEWVMMNLNHVLRIREGGNVRLVYARYLALPDQVQVAIAIDFSDPAWSALTESAKKFWIELECEGVVGIIKEQLEGYRELPETEFDENRDISIDVIDLHGIIQATYENGELTMR